MKPEGFDATNKKRARVRTSPKTWTRIRKTAMKACTTGFNATYHEDGPTIEEVRGRDDYTIVEFGAPWCEHCQAAEAAVKRVLSDHSFSHIKIFDGAGKRLGRAFKVKLWPTLILLKSGEEIARLVRPTEPEELSLFLKAAFD